MMVVTFFNYDGVGGRGGEGEEGRPDLSNTNTGASVAGVEYSL